MLFRKEIEKTKSYQEYVSQQNVVADYHADQTAKINYDQYLENLSKDDC